MSSPRAMRKSLAEAKKKMDRSCERRHRLKRREVFAATQMSAVGKHSDDGWEDPGAATVLRQINIGPVVPAKTLQTENYFYSKVR